MNKSTWIRLLGAAGLALSVFGAFTLILSFMIQEPGLAKAAYVELGLGIVFLGAYLFNFFGEAMSALYRQREAVFGITGAILVLFILVGINVVSQTQLGEKKFDLTLEKVHSLSDTSKEIAKNLPQKIEVLSFLVTPGPRAGLQSLYDLYDYYGGNNLELKQIDPDQDPTLLTQFDAEVDEIVFLNTVTNQTTKLNRGQINEENFSTALRRVISGEDKIVYFLQGDSQIDLADDKTQAGFFVAKLLLEQEGYKVRPLSLLENPVIPEDAQVIVSWGLSRGLSEQTSTILEDYLKRGGKLVIGQNALVAPSKDRFSSTGYEGILNDFGLRFDPAILLQNFQFGGRQIQVGSVVTNEFESHPMMETLKATDGVQVQLTQAQPVLQAAGYQGKASRNVLLKSLSDVVAAKDLKKLLSAERQSLKMVSDGPHPLAQIAEMPVEKTEGQFSDRGVLVVFGDANFAANDLIQKANNADLFLNVFGHLLGRPDSVTIRARSWKSSTLNASDSTKRAITFASVFAFPQLILLMGLVIWTIRRSRA